MLPLLKARVRQTLQKTPVEAVREEKPATKKIVAKDIDLSMEVTVRNGFQGALIYKSHKTGEKFEWDGFGDEQYMELKELKSAKTSSKNSLKTTGLCLTRIGL